MFFFIICFIFRFIISIISPIFRFLLHFIFKPYALFLQEHVIHVFNEQTPELHNKLVDCYRERISELLESYKDELFEGKCCGGHITFLSVRPQFHVGSVAREHRSRTGANTISAVPLASELQLMTANMLQVKARV
jgi:hypothetical protein